MCGPRADLDFLPTSGIERRTLQHSTAVNRTIGINLSGDRMSGCSGLQSRGESQNCWGPALRPTGVGLLRTDVRVPGSAVCAVPQRTRRRHSHACSAQALTVPTAWHGARGWHTKQTVPSRYRELEDVLFGVWVLRVKREQQQLILRNKITCYQRK
jgi:hypothetical protein